LPDIAAIIEFANKGDWANAARHCEEILRADACNVAAHYYYGLVLQYTGAKLEAEQAWRRAIYLDRDFALAHYQLGLARKDAHDVPGSSRAFRNAIEVLNGTPDERPVSPCDQITALDLRELAAQQLELLARQ
jgi:chemotaxis protein methyltransferase CheR